MYNPAHFAETRVDVLYAFIQAHPLATLVTNGDAVPETTQLPVFADPAAGSLRCHMARANPQWRALESGKRALVIFSGADHYITPGWYPSKREHGKVVPTWNYAAVHATGTARFIEDAPALLRHLHELTDFHEADRKEPWSVADAPADYIEAMMRAIVGIEITVERIEGKWKASQNRPSADQVGVIAGLEAMDSQESRAMASLVRECQFTK